MFTEVLPGNTREVLALLEKNKIIQNSYLAGGTALALQLGHRISYDLDFFTSQGFDEQILLSEIRNIANFQLEDVSWRTILGKFEGIKFSIFYYKYPTLYPTNKFGLVNVADVHDISAMKIAAIASRGTKRDFVDLYFICKENLSLQEIIQLYDKKYENLAATLLHIIKSLMYFDDAEPDDMPKMLKKAEWADIKKYFVNEVKKLEGKFFA